MITGKVSTKTKDGTHVDRVLESPVDRHQIRFRRMFAFVLLGVLLLLGIAVWR